MEVANPIYDAVFKFLMEDKKSAIILVSAITDFKIEDLELRPTETTVQKGSTTPLAVYRLDLAAKIATDNGPKLIIIEIQKAKLYTDIMRFRRYLGSQYLSENNYEQLTDAKGNDYKKAIPIYSIYMLGHKLENNSDIPVIKVKRSYIDNVSNKTLLEPNEFIESLTHDSAIIQIPALANRRRDRLEKILSVFDQALIKPDNRHLLNVSDKDDYPEECKTIIRRLFTAIADEEVRTHMQLEDEIFEELRTRERIEANLIKQKEEAVKREQEAVKREEEERRQKDEALKKLESQEKERLFYLQEIEKLKKQNKL